MRVKRPEIPVPAGMMTLPMTQKGYLKPWFVCDDDFRIADNQKWVKAYEEKRCWICGHINKKGFAFVHGPLSAQNNVATDAPSHPECAEYAVQVCPFITLPTARRREGNMPDGILQAMTQSKEGVLENPGVYYITIASKYSVKMSRDGYPLLAWQDSDIVSRSKWVEGSRSENDHLCK